MKDLRRKDNGSGQFASETPRDPFALYELVRVVAQRAAEMVNAAPGFGAIPVLPREVTMVAFDAAAQELIDAGVYKSVPPARSVGKLLPDRNGRPFAWRPLLKLVFDERNIERIHMERLAAPDNPYLGEQHVYYALNMVARSLKKRTLSGLEYQIQREMRVRADGGVPTVDISRASSPPSGRSASSSRSGISVMRRQQSPPTRRRQTTK